MSTPASCIAEYNIFICSRIREFVSIAIMDGFSMSKSTHSSVS